jgi:hypothetical protein
LTNNSEKDLNKKEGNIESSNEIKQNPTPPKLNVPLAPPKLPNLAK